MNVLVINPGNTSTKVAYWEDEKEVWREEISYDVETLKRFPSILDQMEMRLQNIKGLLQVHNVEKIDCVMGRGGLFKPLEGGTYRVNNKMVADIKSGNMRAEHISNIGALLALEIAQEYNAEAFIADPVSVDEFDDVARISGIPELEREALQHTLNIKRTARKACEQINKEFNKANYVVAHLGSGISICPVRGGRIVDANNAIQEGPFSPERAGGLPAYSLMELCLSGNYDKRWFKKRLIGNGGMVAYLGTNDLRQVLKMIDEGDKKAKLIYDAMAYQIAKEIGAMATVLKGNVDAILLTGGLARSDRLCRDIEERVGFIAPVIVFPGENEMEALAEAGFRVLKGEEKPKEY